MSKLSTFFHDATGKKLSDVVSVATGADKVQKSAQSAGVILLLLVGGFIVWKVSKRK